MLNCIGPRIRNGLVPDPISKVSIWDTGSAETHRPLYPCDVVHFLLSKVNDEGILSLRTLRPHIYIYMFLCAVYIYILWRVEKRWKIIHAKSGFALGLHLLFSMVFEVFFAGRFERSRGLSSTRRMTFTGLVSLYPCP